MSRPLSKAPVPRHSDPMPEASVPPHDGPVVTLDLHRFERVRDRAWAFTQMGFARLPLMRAGGPTFWKLCGSGAGEGFDARPESRHWAILAVWEDAAAAEAGRARAPFPAWRARADEHLRCTMRPVSVRGTWSGRAPFGAGGSPAAGPMAVLTRGTVRARHLARFWRRVPGISAAIGTDPSVLLKVGIGEVPWLHQVTFSIWPDAAAMTRFARGDTPHGRAIAAVRAGDWFAEELYARLAVTSVEGTWEGRDPLAGLASPAARATRPRPSRARTA